MISDKKKTEKDIEDIFRNFRKSRSVSTPVAWAALLSVPALFFTLYLALHFAWYHALLSTLWYVVVLLALSVWKGAYLDRDPMQQILTRFSREYPAREADLNAMKLINLLNRKLKQSTASSLCIMTIFVPAFCLGSCLWFDFPWWQATLGGMAVVFVLMLMVGRSENHIVDSFAGEFNMRFQEGSIQKQMAIDTIRKYAHTEGGKRLLAELENREEEEKETPE